MADERTGIKYIGKEPYYKDRIFGTGLVWKSGEALPLAVEVAKEFLKHPTLFQEVKGLTPLMGSTTSSGGGEKPAVAVGDANIKPFATRGDGLGFENLRAPTLVIDRMYPCDQHDHQIVWADDTLKIAYSVGQDRALRKSTWTNTQDPCITWGPRLSIAPTGKSWASRGVFMRVPVTGTLLMGECDVGRAAMTNQVIKRSTNDGSVWTTVLTLDSAKGATFLGPNAIGRDEVTGYIYAVEYYPSGSTGTTATIWRSTDDGATWTAWFQYPMAASGANNIRHWHGCRWDSVSQRMFFFAGDQNDDAGLWRVSADGTTAEKYITNSMIVSQSVGYAIVPARCVDAMFFPDYIAWGNDGGSQDIQYVWRVSRASAEAGAPKLERIGSINSTAWWTQKAADDGTMWICNASNETLNPGRIDMGVHLYALTENGARINEVGVFDMPAGGTISSLGGNSGGGSYFYMRGHNHDTWPHTTYSGFQFRARLALSTIPIIRPTDNSERVYSRQSYNFLEDLTAGQTMVVGHTRGPKSIRKMLIEDIGIKVLSGTGTASVVIYNVTQATQIAAFPAASSQNWRAASNQDTSDYWAFSRLNNLDEIEIRLVETGGSAGCRVSAFVNIAWTFNGAGYENT